MRLIARSILAFLVLAPIVAIIAPAFLTAQNPSAALPKIIGPMPATASPGHPSRNYPYFTTTHLVAKQDYAEEEFHVEGLAIEYAGDAGQTATIAPDGPYAYKTRLIVRRPRSAGRFNGTVILEVINTAAGRDIENDWYWSHEHLMRRGFVHIGVSVHANGIDDPVTGLKQWNRTRYGTLDVTANGKFNNNELSFSILTQVARAAKTPASLLGELRVRNVIATGHSQSAGRLFQYYNRIQPLEAVIDGFVLHGAGQMVRTDIRTPVWKLMSETDVIQRQATLRQPDSQFLRTWEVAGASHADWELFSIMDVLERRDMAGVQQLSPCERPPLSRVPSRLVQDAVYDWMKLWIERGTPPPQAPRIELSSLGSTDAPVSVIARDAHGNAVGGIRLAETAVPVAVNTGLNSGPGPCRTLGSHEPFDAAKLASLYPTRESYMTAVDRATEENFKAGFITREGAEQIRKDAAARKIGR
jgi:hypothetical protein